MPEFSIIVATCNRAAVLRETLQSLSAQDDCIEKCEIIVVDDGSVDDTWAVANEAAGAIPCDVRLFRNSTNRGPGYTQNRAIRAATAPHLLLLHDDIVLAPGSLAAHMAAHRRDPVPELAILGSVVAHPKIRQTVFMKHYDPMNLGAQCSGRNQLPFYLFVPCNLSMKRAFMLEHGMFLDKTGRGGPASHEDVELGFRLAREGLRLGFSSEALGYHNHVYTLDSAIERAEMFGLNWNEFQEQVTDAEFTVFAHILNRRTVRDYVRVLSGPNDLSGKENSLAWHLAREFVRRIMFNRITVPQGWRKLFDMAERSPMVARLIRAPFYHAFLHYYLVRAIEQGNTLHAGQRRQIT